MPLSRCSIIIITGGTTITTVAIFTLLHDITIIIATTTTIVAIIIITANSTAIYFRERSFLLTRVTSAPRVWRDQAKLTLLVSTGIPVLVFKTGYREM